ncbi:MAG TPA: flagellar type III secretion system pore protein FliP [Isosphaeraceae bacterium]
MRWDPRRIGAVAAALAMALVANAACAAPTGAVGFDPFGVRAVLRGEESPDAAARPEAGPPEAGPLFGRPGDVARTVQTVALFSAISLAPAAVLMVTAFVRIQVVLVLLRQALGSPQVPGNQVLTALALLLTALVMAPVAESVYARGIEPFAAGRVGAVEAWDAGTAPLKAFMVDQIYRTHHEQYLRDLYDRAVPPSPGRVEPADGLAVPLRVVAPAFLLSELTTALVIGFWIYLPFLVVDLVVSAVLAAMGLVMLPPSLVAMPLKLILFVLADGWWLVAGMLLDGFATQ